MFIGEEILSFSIGHQWKGRQKRKYSFTLKVYSVYLIKHTSIIYTELNQIASSAGLPQSGKIIWKMNFFFQVREKLENFVDDQGNLERTWKVREKSGYLKIKTMAGFRKFIHFVQEGKECTFSRDSLNPSPSSLGLLLKERICSLGEQILSFKSSP